MQADRLPRSLRQGPDLPQHEHGVRRWYCGVRHYGFLSPASATSIEAVRWLITLHNGGVFTLLAAPGAEPAAKPVPRCPGCGGPMAVLGFMPAPRPAVFDTS